MSRAWWKLRSLFLHQEIITLAFLISFLIIKIPLQKMMELSRFQHYAYALAACAIGFLLQFIWSWRALPLWGRISLACSGLYFASISGILYCNPWLDAKVAVQTPAQDSIRPLILLACLLGGVLLTGTFIGWGLDESKIKHKKNQEEQLR